MVGPVILFLFFKTKIISLNTIIKQRPFAFIFIFILGALLSPPDIISQIFIAIPLCFSYEFIIFIFVMNFLKKIRVQKNVPKFLL